MIPPKTVQDIIEATRIEEVVGDFVTLRRRGINLIGLCPFHGEKSPSFNVNPTRNIFKCFGCGKAGDAITFLREHENMSFDDAVRWLGRKYGIEIAEVERTPEQRAEQQLTDSLFIVNDFAQKHFAEQMTDTDEGKSVALAYFRQRGLREETIQRFGLGYAPEQRDLLLQRAKSNGYSLDLMKQVGLCSSDATRDFFRARVMFPIHNLSGKVAAFAGRTLSKEKNIPKYINSPETAIYVKNKTLYGAFQAKNAIRKHDECILVEGYMDVISLAQAGVENVVASSGTSLTEGQLQLIKRNTQNLTILYDGDAAGVKAALRGLDLALEQDLNVRIALLPDGHDPDSYVLEKGADELREFIRANGKDFILFKTNLLLEETKGDPIKKANLIKDIIGSIARIPDPIKRSVYLKECSALLNVDEEALVMETNRMITGALKKRNEKDQRDEAAARLPQPTRSNDFAPEDYFPDIPMEEQMPSSPSATSAKKGNSLLETEIELERKVAELLIAHGDKHFKDGKTTVAAYIFAEIRGEIVVEFIHPFYDTIVSGYYDAWHAGNAPDSNFFIQHADESVRKMAIDLMVEEHHYSEGWDKKEMPLQHQPLPSDNFERETTEAIDLFFLKKYDVMCHKNKEKLLSLQSTEDLILTLEVQKMIQGRRNFYAQKLNRSIIG